jgi:hypothetical protein
MKITLIISTKGPVINAEAKDLLMEINDLLIDGSEEAGTKLAEFLDFVTVIEEDEEAVKA